MTKCCICEKAAERCHIKSRGAGGSDEDWNLMRFCRAHHVEQHLKGHVYMFEKYRGARNEYIKKGWEVKCIVGIKKMTRA